MFQPARISPMAESSCSTIPGIAAATKAEKSRQKVRKCEEVGMATTVKRSNGQIARVGNGTNARARKCQAREITLAVNIAAAFYLLSTTTFFPRHDPINTQFFHGRLLTTNH